MAAEDLQVKGVIFVAVVFVAVVAVLFSLPSERQDEDLPNSPGRFKLDTTAEDLSSQTLEDMLEDIIRSLSEGATDEKLVAAREVVRIARDPEDARRMKAVDPLVVRRLRDALSRCLGDRDPEVRRSCQEAWEAIGPQPAGEGLAPPDP